MNIYNFPEKSFIRLQRVPCPACNANDSHLMFTARDRLHNIGEMFRYEKCDKCGLIYMNPQVVPDDTRHLYPSVYAPHQKKRSMSSYDNSLPSHQSPLSYQGRRFERIFRSIKKKYRVMTSSVVLDKETKNYLTSQSVVLDVGCGAGHFLYEIRETYGSKVLGIDFSEAAASAAREKYGIYVEIGTIEKSRYEKESIDLITAWWFLEHVNEPQKTVASIHRLLKKGGKFIIAVPNSHSLNAYIFRNLWYHLDCPRHLHVWTPSSLRKVLQTAGLTVNSIRYDRSTWGLIGSLEYLLFGKRTDKFRKNKFLSAILAPLALVCGLLKMGDTIIVYGDKG